MLGFNSYAESPYAVIGGGLAVNAFLTGGAPGTSSAGTLTGKGIANTNSPSVSNTISLGSIKVNIDKELTGVIASTTLNPDVFPDIEEDLVGVGVTITLGTIEVQVTESINPSVSATSAVGTVTSTGKANITPASASATMDLGILASGQSNISVSGVSASYSFNKPTQTAIQKAYSATDYVQAHVVTIHTTIKNKIVYVRN